MKNKKFVYILALSLIISIFGGGCTNQGNLVAEYKGGTITEDEFNTYLGIRQYFNPQITDALEDEKTKEQLLDQYISEKYISGIYEGDKSFSEEAIEILDIFKGYWIEQLGSEEEYNSFLADLGITDDNIIEYIERYYILESYFVEQSYEENKEEFTIATVSHILILIDEERTEEQAKERAELVLQKLEAGEDFSELAKEYSDDQGSKDNGGTYEDTAVSLWVPEFKEAALNLPLNEVSDLIKTDYGYHIMIVRDRKVPTIDEISDEDRERVYAKEYTKFLEEDLLDIKEKTNL